MSKGGRGWCRFAVGSSGRFPPPFFLFFLPARFLPSSFLPPRFPSVRIGRRDAPYKGHAVTAKGNGGSSPRFEATRSQTARKRIITAISFAIGKWSSSRRINRPASFPGSSVFTDKRTSCEINAPTPLEPGWRNAIRIDERVHAPCICTSTDSEERGGKGSVFLVRETLRTIS